MKITMKIMGIEVSEGVSQNTGNQWRCVKMQVEKPGPFVQKAELRVLDNTEGFTRLARFNLQVGLIKTFTLKFRQSKWNDKTITNIDVADVVDATESELNNQDL